MEGRPCPSSSVPRAPYPDGLKVRSPFRERCPLGTISRSDAEHKWNTAATRHQGQTRGNLRPSVATRRKRERRERQRLR